MKAVIFALLFVACVSAFDFGGIVDDVKEKIQEKVGVYGGHDNMKTFWKALGEELDIDTDSVAKCYGTLSAPLYWNWVQSEVDVQLALINSKKAQVAAYGAKIAVSQFAIKKEYGCMMASEGYAQLNKSMGYGSIPDGKLGEYMMVYVQGMGQFNWADYESVYDNLIKRDFETAGTNQAKVYRKQGHNTTHFYNQSFASGINNGVFFINSVAMPNDQWTCFNNEEAVAYTQLLSGWAKAVAEGDASDSKQVTDHYFSGEGGDLMEELKDTFECLQKTDSNAALAKHLEVDIYTKEFEEKLMTYIEKHSETFHKLFSSFHEKLEKKSTLFSGVVLGEVYAKVAGKSILEQLGESFWHDLSSIFGKNDYEE